MPNYLYNGIELPALPDWDKTAYPYAAIYKNALKTGTMFNVATSNFLFNGTTYVKGEHSHITWNYNQETGAWEPYSSGSLDSSKMASASQMIWTNTNILDTDGAVYFAASTPVPVGGVTYDPVSLMQGYWVGCRLRGQRGPHIEPPTFLPSDTWYKSQKRKNTFREIDIVSSYTPTGDESEYWFADENEVGDITCYISGNVLTIAGNGAELIYAAEKSDKMFNDFSSVMSINGLQIIDTSKATTMYAMFRNWDLFNGTLDLSTFNTSNVTDMSRMFEQNIVKQILGLTNFDTKNVTNMSYMFAECKVRDLDLSAFNTSNVTNMRNMFYKAGNLVSLDLSMFDTGNLTQMQDMFDECRKLESINLSNFDTSDVTDLSGVFSDCEKLTILDITSFDTRKVTNMAATFYGCDAMTAIYVGANWSTAKVTYNVNMFTNCGVSNVTRKYA